MTGTALTALRARVDELAAWTSPRVAATADGARTAFAAALAGALGATTGELVRPAAPADAGTGPALATGLATVTVQGQGQGQATGPALVEAARAYLGVPYVWGGESLAEGGLDCSGLVQLALRDLGVTGVPRVARDQAQLGTPVASLAEALPGDLVVFDGGKHIGIYAGDGKMIDAPRPGKLVQLRDVYETPTSIRRVLPQQAAAPEVAWASPAEPAALQRALFEALLAGVAA